MSKKARAPRNPQTIPELVAAIAAKNENLRQIRKDNNALVAAFKKNAAERKAEIAAREKIMIVLNDLRAEAKSAKVAEREAIRAAAAKTKAAKKPVKKPAPKPEKKTTKKAVKKVVPMKKAPRKVPEKIETPATLLMELDPLPANTPAEMEIF